MKKFSKKVTIIFSVVIIAGLLFVALFPLKSSNLWDTRKFEVDPRISEIEDVYLKLFREFKESKLNFDNHISQNTTSSLALKRDPFNFPKTQQKRYSKKYNPKTSNKKKYPDQNQLHLNGILWDENSPSAIINNEIVQVGSYIGKLKVLRIRPEEVILSGSNKKLVLKMPAKRKNIQ